MVSHKRQISKINFDGEAHYINGFLCLLNGDDIRISLIEEKISQNDDGEILISRDGSNQIVMNRNVAKTLAESILEKLNN